MSRVVTHELIHAFDHCRAHVHWFTDVRHLACSEVSFIVEDIYLFFSQNTELFIQVQLFKHVPFLAIVTLT